MKVIPEIVSLGDSLMPVVDSKERDLLLLLIGFGEVGNDANSVFVKGEDRAWMRVGRICPYNSIAL